MYKLPKTQNKAVYKKFTKKELNKLQKDIKNDIFEEVKTEVMKKTFIHMLAIPAMVITDHYNMLTKVEDENGLSRAERLVDMCIFQYECILSNNVKLEELVEYLKTLGISLEDKTNENVRNVK